MEQKENYKTEATCKNCDFSGEVGIPKGAKIEDCDCPNCGCKNLVKNERPIRIIPRHSSFK
jgi:DNA-directed RNA polymerase subunit RPC12/RpoP